MAPPWLLPPSRSRSLLHPRESTPSGSEAPSWLPSPPSRRCGSPSRNLTSPAPELSTASASKKCRPPSLVITYPALNNICSLLFFFTLTHTRHPPCHKKRPSTNLIPSSQTPMKPIFNLFCFFI